eukprot:972994-Amphidinium_carterae.2
MYHHVGAGGNPSNTEYDQPLKISQSLPIESIATQSVFTTEKELGTIPYWLERCERALENRHSCEQCD